MRKSIPFSFRLLASFTITTLLGVTSPVQSQGGASLEKQVDEYIKPFATAKAFSGAVLIAKGGKILVNKGYGLANYELNVPNTPQTKFHIASLSKAFTAAAILILQERGLLKVNDPLTKYIPDYPNGAAITLHHLLVHTSGIPNVNDFPDYNLQSRSPQTPETLIALFKNKPAVMKVGERYNYSNSNYNLLAYIIEKVSGKSYGEFLKANIFDPLGMQNTGHDGRAGALLANRAAGYVPVGVDELENAPYLDWTIKTGNGSLYSTVEDLYRWDRALYTEKFLQRSSLDQLFAEHLPNVGYGWFISRRHNRRCIRFAGRSPGFQCEFQRYVADDVCVIVLSNNYAGTASMIISDLAALVLGEKYEALQIASSLTIAPQLAKALVGRYQGDMNFIRPNATLTVAARNNQLILNWGPGTDSGLIPLVDGTFWDRQFGGIVRFVKDEKGEVSQLVWQNGSDYPAQKVRAGQ